MTPPRQQNIALFGGSFNPVHIGHMMVAQYVAQFTPVDQVWMLVSPRNPLKPDSPLAPDSKRLEMLELACAGDPQILASDFEFSLPTPSYTCNTLSKLKESFPHLSFSLLIGADNWLLFHQWRSWEEILTNYPIYIYPRPGYEIDSESLPPSVTYLSECPTSSLSSTFIRQAIRQGKNISHFLPAGVYNFILNHNLY